jgi:hypothetical protein
MTDFARIETQNTGLNWRSLLVGLIKVGHLPAPLEADTKLEAQAQWEANQTLPLLITLLIAGISAVLSQMVAVGQNGSLIWIALFGACALSAVTRVGRSYRQAFVRAHIVAGLDADSAEALYQGRYAD